MAMIARSLDTLRTQINERYPQRSKLSDGWIGDAAHSSRKSDHNPNTAGVVCALDITHDPANGCDAGELAETLRLNRDPRLAYVISNARIFSSTNTPWQWRQYNGANRHDKHCHISVKQEPALYDDPSPWALERDHNQEPDHPEPPPNPHEQPPAAWMIEGARQIISWETARDANGKVAIHYPADGSFEVAGINSNWHMELATKLRDLVKADRQDEAERLAAKFIVVYTNPVAQWVTDPGVEFYLRDCWFNRGASGAANILQRAVGVTVDEDVGDKTLEAVRALAPTDLLLNLRKGREAYELAKYGRRAEYWDGLVNRWDRALVFAQKLVVKRPVDPAPPEPDVIPEPPPPITGAHDIAWVQRALNYLGATPPLDVDNSYGGKTKRMVEIFQSENDLPVTGFPDAATISEIEEHLQSPGTPDPTPYVPPIYLPEVDPKRKGFWDWWFNR